MPGGTGSPGIVEARAQLVTDEATLERVAEASWVVYRGRPVQFTPLRNANGRTDRTLDSWPD